MATFLRTRVTLTLGVIPPPLLTFYWDSTGAAQSAIVTEAHARVRAFFNASAAVWPTGMTVNYNPVADEVEETTGEIVSQVSGSVPAAVTFSGATDILPLQTQALLRYSTNLYRDGRRLQGRTYLPFRLEGNNDTSGVPTAAFVGLLNTSAASLGTTIATSVSQRVWSRPTLARPGLSAPVIARSASTQWAVQKGRR